MLEMKNVSLSMFGAEKDILKDISWHIKAGENWILFGKNGSGKTKLLEIITGYRHPTNGHVRRFGLPLIGSDIRELRKRIGYVSTPLKEMFSKRETILDVLLSGLFASIGIYKEVSAADKDRAVNLLSQIDMEKRASERFSILSDGEKQKVLMLRALIADPDLLILDEPSMGLDLSAREDLLEALEKTTDVDNTSIIYVTHHTEEITPLFKKVFILNEGACSFSGEIENGVNDEVMSRVFGKKIAVENVNGRYYSMIV